MVPAVRFPIAIVSAATVAFLLFWVMNLMIAYADMRLGDDRDRERIEFVRVRNDTQVQQKERELPNRVKPKPPPEAPKMDRSNDMDTSGTAIAVDTPKIDTDLDLGKGLDLGPRASDSDEVPVVRVEPMYPRRAAAEGIEGWVLLQFDVSTTGATKNVKVIDANPARIFDRAAVRAVKKWKYRPKVIDGKALEKRGLKVKLNFRL